MRSDLLARYTIGEPIYENEFIVYPSEDQRMKRSVYIVVPDVSLKADKARFERAWASINEAKSLPPLRFVEIDDLIAATPEDDNFYIVEKRPARTLRQYLEEQEIIAFEKAAEIGRHILEGLATLHGAGYAHNALTDQCIYVSEDYSGLSVRIGNLHLISRIGDHIIPPYAPEFGAPEIYATGTFSASPALDIYATGMIAYKLFLSRQAYAEIFHSVMIWEDEHQREQSWKNIHLDAGSIFPRLDMLTPGSPSDLASLIERMLSRNAVGRPPTAADALHEFRNATIGRHIAQQPMQMQASRDTGKPKKKLSPVTIALIAALVLVTAGVGVVTIPMILGPDKELVASVDVWKAEAERRKAKAIEAEAPERPVGDPAKGAFTDGSTAMTDGGTLVEKADYEKALVSYKLAAGKFAESLVDIAHADVDKARDAAVAAHGEKAPAFADADKTMKEAAAIVAAEDPRTAIDGFGKAKTGFDALAKTLKALDAAQKSAAASRDKANGMGGADAPEFAKYSALLASAGKQADEWKIDKAVEGYGAAQKAFETIIADILSAKDDAAALKQKIAKTAALIVKQGGGSRPEFAAFAPRIAYADKRFAAEAYRQAIAAYQPILADLIALSQKGFCPSAEGITFTKIEAGSYPLANMRLMTSSLGQIGNMLGIANGAIKVEKPFCMQSRSVSRADMAAYYTAIADKDSAASYGDNPDQPANDVPLAAAQGYAAWVAKQLNAPIHVPTAMEWMAGAANMPPEKLADNGDILLQWSATPCESGGSVAFMAQEGSTFVVCSDAGTGGLFRISGDLP